MTLRRSNIEKSIRNQKEQCRAEAFAYLRKAAEDTIFYVGMGSVIKRDLATKYGLTLDEVMGILSVAAVNLVDKIRELEV